MRAKCHQIAPIRKAARNQCGLKERVTSVGTASSIVVKTIHERSAVRVRVFARVETIHQYLNDQFIFLSLSAAKYRRAIAAGA